MDGVLALLIVGAGSYWLVGWVLFKFFAEAFAETGPPWARELGLAAWLALFFAPGLFVVDDAALPAPALFAALASEPDGVMSGWLPMGVVFVVLFAFRLAKRTDRSA